ncbi:aldehyde dehydrogenase family protein [Tolumonas lignilytica]|uniref:aldehyde dehydrogenase family protein n=1 Tax=Tolumonas lignilytica TaxID=1283284 RepID=UPI0004AEC337|nr:aldehyde dehydrogenase family protein [Tolumonas lignilytica]
MISITSFQNTKSVYIDGQWLYGAGESLQVLNPANKSVITTLTTASLTQVNDAVSAAKAAFSTWGNSTFHERSRYLLRIAALVEKNKEALIQLQQLNSGKPLFEAELDVSDVISTFRYYADYVLTLENETDVALPSQEFSATLSKEPIGVAALIMPWNFPMVTTSWKLAPALAAGCTVILKPSEITPIAEIALMRLIASASLPNGVVNLVTGKGADIGDALISHPDVNKISFTGSNKVGQHIMRQASRGIKYVSLELGGKSSLIVLADADIDQAAELALGGAFFNAGQMCSATSRVLVDKQCYHALLERLKQQITAYEMPPIINETQWLRVSNYIQQAKQAGLSVINSDKKPSAEGYHFPATIVTGLTTNSPIWREEIFGPVMCVMPFDNENEAIRLANDTEYGLVASIVGKDKTTTHSIARQLQVGMVWVNSPQVIFPQTSWGGYKQSSLGRELGPWGLAAYQEIKHVIYGCIPQEGDSDNAVG